MSYKYWKISVVTWGAKYEVFNFSCMETHQDRFLSPFHVSI